MSASIRDRVGGRIRTLMFSGAAALSALGVSSPVLADTTTSTASAAASQEAPKQDAPKKEEPAPAQPSKPAPAPYNLPFQLRGVAIKNSVRLDSTMAFFDQPAGSASALASFLTGTYRVTPEIGAFLRGGLINLSPAMGDSGLAFTNLAAGGQYLLGLGDLRLLFVGAVVLPTGSGGGDMPDALKKAARGAGAPTRSAMDNALFAVNDLAVFPGIDVAWVKDGFTVQAEASLIFAFRVRGETDQKEDFKLNFVSGLHAGYYIQPWISAGVELRYQRFFTPPAAIDASPQRDTLIDNLTFGIGPRFHFKVGDDMWLRPAITYSRGLDDPMSASKFNNIQLDIPLVF